MTDAFIIRCIEIVRPIYESVCDDGLVADALALARAPAADEAAIEALCWRADAACCRLIGDACMHVAAIRPLVAVR